MSKSTRAFRALSPAPGLTTLEQLEPRRLLAVTSGAGEPIVEVDIDPGRLYQEWEGFGASMMDWWTGGAYDDPAFFNAMVTDLGTSMVRLPLNPGFEPTNDNGDSSGINPQGFDKKAIASTMRFAQELQKRVGEDFQTLTTLWTPPWWMKTTGTHTFGGSLRADMREELAEYLVAYVVTAERDYGVPIDVISLQNEPHFIEPYDSALYTPEQMALTLKVVADRFEAEGIDTRVMIPEDMPIHDRWVWWEDLILDDPEINDLNYMWGTHWTPDVYFRDLQATVRETGKPLWLTEAAGKGADHWLAALRMSEDIGGMMNETDISAFFEWQFDAEYGNDPTSSLWSNGKPTNRFYAMSHYSKWIRPGAHRTDIRYTNQDVDQNKQRDIYANSFYDAELDAQTIVLTNNYTEPVEFQIDIAGDRAGQWRGWLSTGASKLVSFDLSGQAHNQLSVVLPARSMMTLHDGETDPTLGTNAATARGNVTLVYPKDSAAFHPLRSNSIGTYYEWMEKIVTTDNVHDEFINGRDALFLAAASPNPFVGTKPTVVDAIQLLLDYGADIDKQDNEGITPLMVAASTPMLWFYNDPYTSVLKVKKFVDSGADLSMKDDMGRTALHWAAQTTRWLFVDNQPHDPAFVQYLLDVGADVNKVDRFGMTPLMWADAEGATGNAAVLAAWANDTAAPEILDGAFSFETGQQITLDFDEAMANLSPGGFQLLRQLDDGSFGGPGAFTFAGTTLAAGNTRVSLTPEARLANGYYVARARAGGAGGATDVAGNAVAQPLDVPFWFLNADANRDKVVGQADYNLFMANFGQQGVGFSGGDFDYNGRVDMDDWAILQANWGLSLGSVGDPNDPPSDPGDPPPGGSGGGEALPPAPGGDTGGDPADPADPVDPADPADPADPEPPMDPPVGRPGGPVFPEPPIPPTAPDDPTPPADPAPEPPVAGEPGAQGPGQVTPPPAGTTGKAALARRLAGGAGRNVTFQIAREMGLSHALVSSSATSSSQSTADESSVLTGLPRLAQPLGRLSFATGGPIRMSDLLFDETETLA